MFGITKKGQTIMSDFSISLSVFLIVLFMALSIYNDIKENYELSGRIDDVNQEIDSVANKLIRNKGVPREWNNGNVEDIGWSEEYPLLNKTKLNYTYYMDYAFLKNLLRTDYDFQINITYKNGSLVNLYGNNLSYGSSLDSSASIVSHMKRIAYIEKNGRRVPVSVNIYMWNNKVL